MGLLQIPALAPRAHPAPSLPLPLPRLGADIADVTRNQLLRAMRPEDLQRLLPHLERIELAQGALLHAPGREIHFAYFPVTAVVSLVLELESGASAEVASIGHEGLVGVLLCMGARVAPRNAMVCCAGRAYRVRAQVLKDEFIHNTQALHLMLRYTQALITQISQTVVCNRHHSLEQRMCRWLLSTVDRLNHNQLQVTQEVLAGLLGVRREGVTEVALRLRQAGLIDYRRGRLEVLDSAGLAQRACECYQVVRQECERLQPACQHEAARSGG